VTSRTRQESTGSADEATQGAEAKRDLAWAEASIWSERMLSALVNGVKGGKWYSLIDKVMTPTTLKVSWHRVRANKGAAGVDGLSIGRFAAKADLYLSELAAALREGCYRPQAVKRVDIPKGDGRTRPLGVPTVKDRIVQQAVKLAIEPIFEVAFCEGSYGFRPGRGCHDALREVDRRIKEGYTFVVDADLASYFDSIPHERLMARVEEKVSDGRLLDLIRAWLDADILKGLERWTPTSGTPQGAVLSPLLANIYLDPLDRLMAERGYHMVRYADDFVILTRSREEADAALALVRAWVAENGLTLHPEKTRVGDCRQPGEGFDFLGYRFAAGRRDVRDKSLMRVNPGEDAAQAGRQPRMRDRRSQSDAPRLVRLLQARPSLHLPDARRVHPTPAACAPAQAGETAGLGELSCRRSALAKCLLRECRAVRASHGLAHSKTVSMKKPPTGEPYAGKPPVRFGGRGG
jgi:RNA-directed DNA polymerase